MMPMTPSGTTTRWILSPFGRSHSAVALPIGSGSATTASMLVAIASMRRSSRRSRSSRGALRRAARAAYMSRWLAVGLAPRGAATAAAAAASASFFCCVGASASTAAAPAAALPSPSINSPIWSASMALLGYRLRGGGGLGGGGEFLAHEHQVVAMDHLVTAAKPQDIRDLRGPASHDAGGVHVGIS